MADRVRAVLAARTNKGRRSHMRMSILVWVAIVGAASLVGLFDVAMAGTIPQTGAEPSSVAVNAVPSGTHFLVRLDDELSTGKHKVNKKFEAKTLEPLKLQMDIFFSLARRSVDTSAASNPRIDRTRKNLAELRRY